MQDVFVDNRYISADTWYDDDRKAFQPQIHYCVGGATKFYPDNLRAENRLPTQARFWKGKSGWTRLIRKYSWMQFPTIGLRSNIQDRNILLVNTCSLPGMLPMRSQ